MAECFKCGVSGEKSRLHDVISNRGIVKICDECASSENLPTVKRITKEQLEESQKQRSIRDRLTNMNNRNSILKKEVTLRDIIDKNLKKNQPPSDLIENFHWTIQRIKRARKITREEFAKAIGENEATIRMIENGFIPNNDYKLINKIESYLKVSLRKSGESGFSDPSIKEPSRRYILDNSLIEKEEQKPKKLSFSIPAAKELKISDLKEMKKRQDTESKRPESKKEPIDSWENEYSQDDEKFLDEREEFDDDDFDEK